MTRYIAHSFLVLTVIGSGLLATTQANADEALRIREWTYASGTVKPATCAPSGRAVLKHVQRTSTYEVARPEVPSGSRLTLFANFLGQKPGLVLLCLGGTSAQCDVIEWKERSVTIELPCLGLSGPKNADVRIILPDGRVAKNFPVLFVAQPDILVHGESVPQPMTPAPETAPPSYSVSVRGGLMLYAQN